MAYRLGIAGPFGSGKSTLARELRGELPHAQILSFAKPLKDLCAIQYDDSSLWEERIVRWLLENGFFNPNAVVKDIIAAFDRYPSLNPSDKNRPLLQYVGTEIIRNADPDFWIRASNKYVSPNAKFVIFDDLRFPNEAGTLHGVVEIVGVNYDAHHISEQRLWAANRNPEYTIRHMFKLNEVQQLAARIRYHETLMLDQDFFS